MERQHTLVRLAVALTIALSPLAACSHDSVSGPAAAAAISAVAGSDAQVGVVGQTLGTPISVHVVDANGSAVAGVAVSWAIESGGGSIDVTSSFTDSLGNASVDWTLGTVTGANTLSATASGISSALTFTASAAPGAAVALVKVSGDGQVVTAGSTTAPLVVKAVDTYGNAVPGVTVNWLPEDGGALSVSSSITGSDGLAQATLITNQAATYDVMAELGSSTTVETTFTVTSN